MVVVRGLCLGECVACACVLECQSLCGVWLFGDCGGKISLCVYLCCVIQEVPGRDEPVWNGMVFSVHGCIVGFLLSVVRCCVIVLVVASASWMCDFSGSSQGGF